MMKSAARVALAGLAGLVLAGCTVQPLYAPKPEAGTVQTASLAPIYIEPVDERVGQELRNALIFLLNGGSGQPANPQYNLTLDVRTIRQNALIVQISDDEGDPTARTVTVDASYLITRTNDTEPVAKRRARASASYDVSNQEFANNRAERDAETRAAREVAEQLRGLIAADLKRDGAF